VHPASSVICDMHQPFSPTDRRTAGEGLSSLPGGAAGHMAKWGMPYRWLGRWLDDDDFRTAAAWVGGLHSNAYPAVPTTIGRWSLGTLEPALPLSPHVLDLDNPRYSQKPMRAICTAHCLACFGLSRLYDAETARRADNDERTHGGDTRGVGVGAAKRGIRTLGGTQLCNHAAWRCSTTSIASITRGLNALWKACTMCR